MLRIIFLSVIVFVAAMLSACGGGGGGGGSTTTPPTQNKTFTVTLDDIEINRTSNSDTVTVDTSSVTSGDLSYNPN